MPGLSRAEALLSLKNGLGFWLKEYWANQFLSAGNIIKFTVLIFSPIFPAIIFWIMVFRHRAPRHYMKLYFFIWSFTAILYWFFTAPSVRFGGGFFWVFLALSALFLFSSESKFNFDLSWLWLKKGIRGAFLSLWSLGIVCGIGIIMVTKNHDFFSIGKMPSYPVKEYIVNTDNPFTIYLPVDPAYPLVGNSILPSARQGDLVDLDHLEMREPNDLSKGFRTR
jgi:hypothetical protein